jgi:hypothetical protein
MELDEFEVPAATEHPTARFQQPVDPKELCIVDYLT